MRRHHILSLFLMGLLVVLFQNCTADFVPLRSLNTDLASLHNATTGAQVRRMSNLEYRNSLNDTLLYQFQRYYSSQAQNIVNHLVGLQAVAGPLSTLPTDLPLGRLVSDQLASNLTDDHFTAYLQISKAVAANVISNNWLQYLAGTCATPTTFDATCVDTFITQFGTLAFRQPPTADERTELKSGASDWQTLIGRILVHPRFLLHLNRDGTPLPDGSYQLTAYELEAKLTATFWKSVPDVAGIAAAANGSVLTTAGLKTELARILASQHAKDALWTFYSQWFALQRLPSAYYNLNTGFINTFGYAELNPDGTPKLDTNSQPIIDRVQDNARMGYSWSGKVASDARAFLEYYTFTTDGTLHDIFTSNKIFASDPDSAIIYGLPAALAAGTYATDTTGHYNGILTRIAITAQSPGANGDINHIQRGVFILTNLAGQSLGQPANFAEQQMLAGQVPAHASTRVQTATLTSPGSCMSCHGQINPVAYAMGHYNSLGAYITTEQRFASDGTQTATNPVDSSTSLPLNGKSYTLNSPDDLVNALFDSGAVYKAFANYYFTFAFGRQPVSTADQSTVGNVQTGLQSLSIKNALTGMALQPEFARAYPPQGQ